MGRGIGQLCMSVRVALSPMSGKSTSETKATKSAQAAEASAGISYAAAGVDIEAGDRAVELFKPLAKKASRPEVRGVWAVSPAYSHATVQGAGSGRFHRRGRHQTCRSPGHGQARHRRTGPGGHIGRRPRRVRGRTAVPAGLHRGRAHRSRAGGCDRHSGSPRAA